MPSPPLEEKVPDRADEEVVQLIFGSSSPRPSPPEEERVACRSASAPSTLVFCRNNERLP